MIRTVLALLFITIYFILSLPLLLIDLIIRKFSPVTAEMILLRIDQFILKIILLICGTKVTAKGLENVPKGEAVLFIGNHQSYFDVIISYSLMKNRCGYIAKDSLKKVPILAQHVLLLSGLFLNRTDPKKGIETIRKAIDYVADGTSIFIFPEGTRNRNEDETELLEFHRGSFKIAQRTGCKIIPVSFTNTSAVFEKNFPKVKKQCVIVEFGTPVAYGDLTKEEQRHIDEHFRGIIAGMLKHNQKELPGS